MALQYVNSLQIVKERFVGVVGYILFNSKRSEYVEEDGESLHNRNQAYFVFYLHLMLDIFGLMDTFSKYLQNDDHDILEVASLVKVIMKILKALRENGFTSLLENVFSFCQKHDDEIVEMSEFYVTPRNRSTEVTNQHHYEIEIFNTVMDMQIQEFRDRFSEVITDLLEYMTVLSPCRSFSYIDNSKLVNLSDLYKSNFDHSKRAYLEVQLETYYHSLIDDERFANLKDVADLSRLMVETGNDRSFPLVYRLLKLTLVLPVATATVEQCFSAIKLLKTDLCNSIGDDFLNYALISSVEKEALIDVKIKRVIGRSRKMDN